MTRGRIAIITPEGKIISSTEFNGDMYFDGHGKEIYDELDCLESVEEYKEFVERFNEDNFGYKEKLFYDCDGSFRDMEIKYFDKWFSDYVYIKNLSEKPMLFNDANGKLIALDCNVTAVFNLGEFIAADLEDFEKQDFIDKLNEQKNSLCGIAETDYSDIYNMCCDFDNDHRDSYLTDRIMEHDFVDEEVLEYIIKDQSQSLSRLRCFIGDTYDDIYILDGYGNLKNAEKDDFEDLIDDLVYDIQSKIYVPLAKQEACL